MAREHPGYRARNLDVAKMYGLNSGLCKIERRMKERKDCPLWLLRTLDDLIFKSNCLISPLIEHRDELPPFLKETPNEKS